MVNKSWSILVEDCPIDIERIKSYAMELETLLPNKVNLNSLDKAKENVLFARGKFNLMITTLSQVLYDREILKTSQDKILYAWMIDNFGRYLKRLDDAEYNLIVQYDEPTKESAVGISRISSYSNLLRTSADSIIYESLLKATKEYKSLEKDKQDKRTFLYILFQTMQITISILGGLSREKMGGMGKKAMIETIPTSFQSLMSPGGQELIKKGYQEQTGTDISKIEEALKDLEEDEDND